MRTQLIMLQAIVPSQFSYPIDVISALNRPDHKLLSFATSRCRILHRVVDSLAGVGTAADPWQFLVGRFWQTGLEVGWFAKPAYKKSTTQRTPNRAENF